MRILIGGAQFANKGAQSMLFSVMDQFRKHYGEVTIDYLPVDDFRKYTAGEYKFNAVYGGSQAHLYEDSNPLRRCWIVAKAIRQKCIRKKTLPLRDLRRLHNALKNMDAYVDISGFSLSSKWSADINRRRLQAIEDAKKYGKKVILFPQSFGPFDYGENQAEMDERIPRVLGMADLIFAREEEGQRLLREKYGLTNVRLSTDLVLQANDVDWRNITFREPELRYPTLATRHNVGIIPNKQTFRHGDGEQILSAYRAIIEELLRLGKRVYIFCHSNDQAIAARIYEPFSGNDGVTLIEQEFSCWEYSEFVKQFDFVIASRFHAVVHAYKQGIPALILGWAIKYRELAQRFGQQGYVFDITQNYQTGALIEALGRLSEHWEKESRRIRAALHELNAHTCFDACWELLDGSAQAPAGKDAAHSGETIQSVRDRGLCISCGICAANCPKGCIAMVREGNEILPRIDGAACVRCGICAKVCPPPVQLNPREPGFDLRQSLLGDFRKILCVQAKDRELLAKSTSGGFVTQFVRALLEGGDFQSAFLIDGYEYDAPLSTRRFAGEDARNLGSTPGSRYLVTSHEAAARYLIAHPEERIAFVATPCATQGLLNTIALRHLSRENYLFIGLFCDKTMHHGVVKYFAKHPCGRGRELRKLYFRTKESGGWPGNVRLEYADGSHEDLPRTERMKLKNYFVPERCLYCLDKLNRNCDIAVGDNYIPRSRDALGANSCILRTERGQRAWNKYCDRFDSHEDSAEELAQAQDLEKKRQNLQNARIKGLCDSAASPDADAVRSYRNSLKKIAVGKRADCYRAVESDLRRREAKDKAVHKFRCLKKRLRRFGQNKGRE